MQYEPKYPDSTTPPEVFKTGRSVMHASHAARMARNEHVEVWGEENEPDADFDKEFNVDVQADVIGNPSEGFRSDVRLFGPIPKNPLGMAMNTARFEGMEGPQWQAQTRNFNVNTYPESYEDDYYGTEDFDTPNPHGTAYSYVPFRTERRATVAGEAMAKRIVEGRNVTTGRSD